MYKRQVYTGILLGSAPAIPLWNTWLLPVLFTVSALDTGLAAVSIVAAVVERDQGVERVQSVFEKTVMALVVLEAAVLAAFLVMMQQAGGGAAVSAGILTGGALSIQFWALVVVVGLAGPFALALVQVVASRKSGKHLPPAIPVGGATCALIGGFTLRFVILAAGVHAALVSPDALQAVQGVLFYL